jgi:hypothetical protein
MALLEEVFKRSGVPSYTFVQPARYDEIRVSLRTPGRCCVIEGPSGIGKTTSVKRILSELGMGDKALELSGRKAAEVALISELPQLGDLGVVIIDDFHRLPEEVKSSISDLVKTLADEEQEKTKIVILGINKAGDQLVRFGHDVGLRIDVFKMEANSDNKIEELIAKGEAALNIEITDRDGVVARSIGSFQIAQMLCHGMCVRDKVIETEENKRVVSTSIEVVVDAVIQDLRRMFLSPTISFARGSKLRREGRAPYLHILRWLAEESEWSIDLRQSLRARAEHRGSVGQVVEKGYLETLLKEKAAALEEFFYYQPETSVISIEDPRLMFYLKNLNWRVFAKEVGFRSQDFKGGYDFALSFAGEDRKIAERLEHLLSAREISVFYDKNEQHRIIAVDVEDYLAPIYRTEAAYVIALLGKHYPRKIWTKFESDNFKARFGEDAIIAISFSDAPAGFFGPVHEKGGLFLRVDGDVEAQLIEFAEILAKRIIEDREDLRKAEAAEAAAPAEVAAPAGPVV